MHTIIDNTTNKQVDRKVVHDFKHFLAYTWKEIGLPTPTPMQLHIADYLQEGHSRMVLQALRGIGKTWITGAFASWRLLRNPNEKILIVSQSGTHAEAIAVFIKKLIHTLPILDHLKARNDQKNSTMAFDVNGCSVTVQPSVKALGITGQLQGNRATLLISDDVEGQQNSATEDLRAKLRNATAEYEAILQTDEKSQIIVLGTPQSAESIYNGFREDGYVTRVFPARYPEDLSVYHGCLAPYIDKAIQDEPSLIGQPIDSRFTEEDLTRRENRYGRSGFKLQFMLDTTLSDAERYPLKLHDLIVSDLDSREAPLSISYSSDKYDRLQEIPNVGFQGDGFFKPSFISPERLEYETIYMGIDPAGRGKDALGYAIIGQLQGKLFLLDAGGLFGGYIEENLVKLSLMAEQYRVNKIYIEDNFGDGMFTSLLKPILHTIYPVTIEDVRHNTQKEMRIIDTLEPVLNQHRLVVDKSLVLRDISKALETPQNLPYSLFFQLSHITKDRGSLAHDDVLDTVAMVVKQFMRLLMQNPDEVLASYKEKVMNKNIDTFMSIVKKNRAIGSMGVSKRPATRSLRAFNR